MSILLWAVIIFAGWSMMVCLLLGCINLGVGKECKLEKHIKS